MIDRSALLRDLQKEVTALEDAITERIAGDSSTQAHLRAEHQAARAARRTAETFEMWCGEQVTQSAVAWVLACVFTRFLEDNQLLPKPHLSGPGSRRQLALDQRQLYFQRHPTETDREYLQQVFRDVATLPAAGDLLGEKHNPLWALAPTGDGAARLLAFFQRIVPETGEIAHDFTDPRWNSRFLGDLYQDLSAAARKKYALLQTPEFVEEFILDRTLTPAIETFGYQEVRLIDPTCGSGHFLLGAFHRLFALHQKLAPGTNSRDLAQRALDQVAGVDLNPFAVAIARFRLLLVALKVSRITRLADAPAFQIHLAVGDSLLHGKRFGLATKGLQPTLVGTDPLRHVYDAEDAEALRSILCHQYHSVVGNPPYITVKDKALNEAYRKGYGSCHRQYSLGVPFTERFFELAITGDGSTPAGSVGMITANSFMKREFGQKLIENVLPKLDLTHVIDTSGAYIPGHGTPTVILFGRNRPPAAETVRTVMGIRGEPTTPADPAQGLVWRAIVAQIDQPDSESDFVGVADYPRARFSSHPWSIGGGGAGELKELLEARTLQRLGELTDAIGRVIHTGCDEAYFAPIGTWHRYGLPTEAVVPVVEGDTVRDWGITPGTEAIFPYDQDWASTLLPDDNRLRALWRFKSYLVRRREPGGTHEDIGLTWYEWSRFQRERFRTPLSIAFAFVATHNHFVLDRGGKVFKQSAPVIKLPGGATEADYLALLGLLNSSTACFWMKQVFFNKGATSDKGVLQDDPEKFRFEFDGTKLSELPIPTLSPAQREVVVALAHGLDQRATTLASPMEHAITSSLLNGGVMLADRLNQLCVQRVELRREMVRLQEELDWFCYEAFGLLKPGVAPSCQLVPCDTAPPIDPAARPYRVTEASLNLTPLDARRLEIVRTHADIAIIESPAYKRRWFRSAGAYDATNLDDFTIMNRALRSWILDRLEGRAYWEKVELQSLAHLAERAKTDDHLMRVAHALSGHPDFELSSLVTELVESEAVPAVPACRYTATGMLKRAQWAHTWRQQRLEDSIDARTTLEGSDSAYITTSAAAELKRQLVGEIAVPPRYASVDFQRPHYWTLRGKLDVPKERFISFPYCEREGDPSLVVGWAGWNLLQQAEAVAAYYVTMKDTEGWPAQHLTPLLAALHELVPWLEQWHNDLHPEFGVGMGDYYRGFVETESHALGLTADHLANWKPTAAKNKGKAKQQAS